ncbi:phage tail terminator-like protein [Campylobacter concisus]|uniref:phage tail terminator-like protein n=1 Tax=Campylobacter concisus TaxID=199 RepID=UPI000D2F9C41|nr:phage tail terminator-like protein [Campylobacter concisus]
MLRIRQALEKAVLAVTPAIDTAFENTTFNPRAGEPYQQLHFLPAKPSAAVIDDSISEVLGVFQITLRYPAGEGVKNVLERARLYEKAFKVGVKLENEVFITAPTSVNILGIDGDRYGVAVSIYFKSYKE